MNIKRDGFAEILLVVVILVAAVAAGAYYLGRGTTKPSPSPSPSAMQDASPAPTGAGETADWKTYTSQKFNYSLKYPPNFALKEEEGAQGFSIHYLGRTNFSDQTPDSTTSFGIEIEPVDLAQTIKAIKLEIQHTSVGWQLKEEKKWKIGGHEGVRLEYESSAIVDKITIFVVANGTYSYKITFQHSPSDSSADSILSTFKFLD